MSDIRIARLCNKKQISVKYQGVRLSNKSYITYAYFLEIFIVLIRSKKIGGSTKKAEMENAVLEKRVSAKLVYFNFVFEL